MLAQKGVQRRITVSLPHFLSAPATLLASDAVLTVGARAAEVLQRNFALKSLPNPLPLPTFVIAQAWHQRAHADPGHAWLRRVLIEQASRI